jgi:hypothetical protein
MFQTDLSVKLRNERRLGNPPGKVFREDFLRKWSISMKASGEFMRNRNKFIIGLAALVVVIGLGMYLNRSHGGHAAHPVNLTSTTAQTTNRPIIHARRPSVVDETSGNADSTNFFMLPREKVEEYLRRHNRDAASLLAAFHSDPSGEMGYLYEAATNFPNNPRVQWTVLARNAFPEDRRKWLDNFKASSPSNSLANYLSAQDYFKNNQPEAATKELLAAASKSQFNDFSMDTILDGESLAQFSGSSDMETHIESMAAMASDLLPSLGHLKGVATGIRDAQQQYLSSGDAASAQALAQAGIGMADHLMTGDSGKFIINQLVGIASETIALQGLDQNTGYDFLGGETPAQRLAELKQQKTSISQLTKNQNAVLSLPPDQMANYWERVKIYGELPAMQWMQQQNVTAPNTGN